MDTGSVVRVLTEVHDLLADYPPSTIELTAAVSESGGLGSYGLYGYGGERIRQTIGSLRDATSRPFAVNLWLPIGDEVTPADVDLGPSLAAMAPLYDSLGIEAPAKPAAFLPPIDEQLEAVLDAGPAVLSVVYGVPSGEVVARFNPTVTPDNPELVAAIDAQIPA